MWAAECLAGLGVRLGEDLVTYVVKSTNQMSRFGYSLGRAISI